MKIVVADHKRCLVSFCDRNIHARGLCQNHYKRLYNLVKQSLDTWKNLECAGLCLSTRKSRQFRDVIVDLHKRGIYPSAAQICTELGRMSTSLSGKECRIRTEVFEELGIEKKKGCP